MLRVADIFNHYARSNHRLITRGRAKIGCETGKYVSPAAVLPEATARILLHHVLCTYVKRCLSAPYFHFHGYRSLHLERSQEPTQVTSLRHDTIRRGWLKPQRTKRNVPALSAHHAPSLRPCVAAHARAGRAQWHLPRGKCARIPIPCSLPALLVLPPGYERGVLFVADGNHAFRRGATWRATRAA